MFICGTGNSPQDGADDTSKRSRRPASSASFCRILCKDPNKNHNPYADRGLDKFYALLADLDDRKQKIYTRMGSEEISFVRFVYANDDSNHVKPIVVKVKERTTTNREKANTTNSIKRLTSKNRIANDNEEEIVSEQQKSEDTIGNNSKKKKKKRYLIRCNEETIPFSLLNRLKQPCWYFLAIVVLILVFLAVFGRSFAILCTSIGWYLVPTVVGEGSCSSSSAERKPKRKKEYTKKLISDSKNFQDQNSPSPISSINGLPNNRKIQKLHHGKRKKLLKLSTF